MGIFDIFKSKNEDDNKSNSNRELDRFQEMIDKKDVLMNEHVNICKKLFDGDYYHKDSIHLSLLDKLKQLDDEIQILQSEEIDILKNSTQDIIKTINSIQNTESLPDFKPVPDELWEIFRNKGK